MSDSSNLVPVHVTISERSIARTIVVGMIGTIYQPLRLGQDMTQGQFLSGV